MGEHLQGFTTLYSHVDDEQATTALFERTFAPRRAAELIWLYWRSPTEKPSSPDTGSLELHPRLSKSREETCGSVIVILKATIPNTVMRPGNLAATICRLRVWWCTSSPWRCSSWWRW